MKYRFEQHANDASIELYAMGKLAEADAAVFEEHLLICESCRDRLDSTERYIQAMKVAAARLREIPENRSVAAVVREWFATPLHIWGASAVAVAAVVVLMVQIRPSPMPAAPITITLTAERGGTVSAPAHRRLDLRLDARGVRPIEGSRLELVDSGGGLVYTTNPRWSGEQIVMRIDRDLNAGAYYVRLYGPGGSGLEREFALSLK